METNSKLREALEVIAAMEYPHNFQAERFDIAEACCDLTRAIRTARAALAAPPRNCDVGTAQEQAERWNNENPYPYEWDDRQYYDALDMLKWAQMPYEEGGAK